MAKIKLGQLLMIYLKYHLHFLGPTYIILLNDGDTLESLTSFVCKTIQCYCTEYTAYLLLYFTSATRDDGTCRNLMVPRIIVF